jgi:hypothetical protein
MVAAHHPHRHAASVPLASTLPRDLFEKELAWYFTEAETASSFAFSNFEPLSDTALSGRSGTRSKEGDWSADDRMAAALAARTIRKWLYAMPNRQAGILQAAFTPRDWPVFQSNALL